jgi:tetratricopeptide (TPR) repeat protein
MSRIPGLLLALTCWLSAGTVQAALTDPAQIQTEAYMNLVQADQSLDAGRLDEALAQYNAARDYYQQLAKDFPGWEPRVIHYRKTYCDNQIADVERRLSGGLPEELPELAPEPVAEPLAPAPAPAAERAIEIDDLKSRIASLEAQVAEIDTLQGEVEIVTGENDQLRRDLDAAKQQLDARAGSEQAALAELHSQLANRDKQIETLRKEIEAKQQIDQARTDLEGQVNDLRAENDRLNEEIKTLAKELDGAEVRADQAAMQAKQAEAKLKDAEKDLRKAQNEQVDTAKQLAALQRKPVLEKPASAKEKPKPEAEIAPEPQAKVTEPTVESVEAEPMPPPSEASVMTTLPPKPIPDGISAADYVRRLLQDGENESALATVQDARKGVLADMNLALIEGIALIRLQRYSDAATLLIDLARKNPRIAEVHATLGAAMLGAGLYEEARETLQMAIKLDRSLPECHYNLAQIYAFIDPIDLKLARKYYQQSRDLGLAADRQLEKALQ